MSLDPSFLSLRGRLGAHTLHSRYDSRQLTENARAAARAKLDAELLATIDPDGNLPEGERARRLDHARRAHFARLALKSAQKRRRKGGAA